MNIFPVDKTSVLHTPSNELVNKLKKKCVCFMLQNLYFFQNKLNTLLKCKTYTFQKACLKIHTCIKPVKIKVMSHYKVLPTT